MSGAGVSDVPPVRIDAVNGAPVRAAGDYVLYWMVASRRTEWSFALERAADWCRELGLPLVILEALRCDYPWASARLHRFVLDGMADNRRRLRGARVRYYPYVEPSPGAGRGLLEALAARAAVVVTDRFPSFFLPRMVAAAGRRLEVKLEQVDGNGLLPLAAADRVFARAFDFRRFLQRELAPHLLEPPRADPLGGPALPAPVEVPEGVRARWPAASPELLGGEEGLERLPLDHSVQPVSRPGGAVAAGKALDRFVEERLDGYHENAIAERQAWNPGRLGEHASGKRQGWWGMDEGAEAFLDQLVTWRELGYNMAARRDDHDRYESLPEWARKTLAEHAGDERPHLYDRAELAAGSTHDELWNAAQGQLVREGVIHNYLRMLWGKKIFEWSPSARQAAEVMIELNDRFAVDGRDPNSYSGIFWCLGRYDRAWGPERPIYGKVRYMTSASTRRKYRVDAYVERYAPPAGGQLDLPAS